MPITSNTNIGNYSSSKRWQLHLAPLWDMWSTYSSFVTPWYRCEYIGCNKVYTQKGKLTFHIKVQHNADKNNNIALLTMVTCSFCEKNFSSKSAIVSNSKLSLKMHYIVFKWQWKYVIRFSRQHFVLCLFVFVCLVFCLSTNRVYRGKALNSSLCIPLACLGNPIKWHSKLNALWRIL